MTKRKTKAQREAEAREALAQRVWDIYAGGAGRGLSEDDCWVSPEELANIIPALREVLGGRRDYPSGYPCADDGAERTGNNKYYQEHLAAIYHNPRALDRFADPAAATDYLFDTWGVRA